MYSSSSSYSLYLKPSPFANCSFYAFFQLFSAEGSSQPLSDQSDYSASSSTNVTPSMHPKPEVKVQKFSACYFGNHPVEEGELVPGECVKVVHRSIRKTHSTANIKVCRYTYFS